MIIRNIPRADDERPLAMLRLRDEGVAATEIAEQFNTTKGHVCGLFYRVDADLAKSEAAA